MMSSHNVLEEIHGADHSTPDPGPGGAIRITKSPTVVSLETKAAEGRSLPDPVKEGLEVKLCLKTDGGNCTVTADSPVNQTGNDTMTFDNAGDTIQLVSFEVGSAYVWRALGNDGVALS